MKKFLKKIREIERVAGRKKNAQKPTLYLRVQNKISIYVLYFLLKTPITPNQLTFTMILLGIIASSLFYFGYLAAILGSLLLIVQYIFDSVDGRLARYKKMTSLGGRYLDLIGHALVLPLIFVFITLGFYSDNLLLLAFGFSSVLFMSLVEAAYITKKAVVGEGLIYYNTKKTKLVKKGKPEKPSFVQKAFRYTIAPFFRSGEMFLFLLILSIIGRLDIALYFYGATLPIIAIVRVYTTFKSLLEL